MVALLPYFVRYKMLVPFIAFVLRYVLRYRRKVIMMQLQDSFPEYSNEKRESICAKFYHHLAEMIIATISLANYNMEERRRSTEFDFPDGFADVVKDRDFIVLTSHYGHWEIALNLFMEYPDHKLVGVYRPLKSKISDRLFLKLRGNEEYDVVPRDKFMRYFVANRDGKCGKYLIAGLISDQNCPPSKGCCWHRFLNHDTLFVDGGEQLAMKFRIPVYYLELERMKGGHYRHHFTLIYDGVEDVKPHEITERYVRMLEQTIIEAPEYWLWSHRRWKYTPQAEDDPQFYDNYKTI